MIEKVYLIECDNNGCITYKIGKTSRSISKRIDELRTGNPGKFRVLYEYETPNAGILEKSLHRAYEYAHIKREWFSDSLPTETFLKTCKIFDEAITVTKNHL